MSSVLAVRHLSKTFAGGQPVLRDVDLTIRNGEIHGLVGQNGSGKSTLVKVLSGYHAPDPGARLELNGRDVPLPLAPGESRQRGMSFVHQDLGLADDLSIVDNLQVGRYRTGRAGRIRWPREERHAAEVLERFGLRVDPRIPVGELPQNARAVVAIARAVDEIAEHEGGVLVLDEPTPYLSADAVELLFEAMREAVRGDRMGLLFISHRLDEIKAITDSVTILRDGKVVGSRRTADVETDDLIELIIGRRLEELYPGDTFVTGGEVATVEDLSGQGVGGVSFRLRAGEVLGITGLIGMGAEKVPYLLLGSEQATSGRAVVDGKDVDLVRDSIRSRIQSGIALVPADRTRLGAAGKLTIRENMTLPRLDVYFRRLLIDERRERTDTRQLVERFAVSPPASEAPLAELSGGNQQKAILAKWLTLRPKMLVLHEPTQGVDVGARKQIFEELGRASGDGCAVVLVSMEYEDLAHLCDRVLVMRDGQVVSELEKRELSEERIIERCYR